MTTYPTADELTAIKDPVERVKAAGELAAAGRAAVPIRDAAIMELLAAGELRKFEIAKLAVIGNPQMTRYTKRAGGRAVAGVG